MEFRAGLEVFGVGSLKVEIDPSEEAEAVELDEGEAADDGDAILGRHQAEISRLGRNPKTGAENKSWQNLGLPLLEHVATSLALQKCHACKSNKTANPQMPANPT